MYIPGQQSPEYYAKLEEIKPLRWLDLDDKNDILRILLELSELTTDSKMEKIFKKNAETLRAHFIHPFPMEGKPCPGHDGCRRWVWYCQLLFVLVKGFVAAHNRCVEGSVLEHRRLFTKDDRIKEQLQTLNDQAQEVKDEDVWEDSDWEALLEILGQGYNTKFNPVNNAVVCQSSLVD